MENQGKGPEEIVEEMKRWQASEGYVDPNWLLSSLSDLLRWSAEQMPKDSTQNIHTDYAEGKKDGYNIAIDDCKATLLRLADEICKK